MDPWEITLVELMDTARYILIVGRTMCGAGLGGAGHPDLFEKANRVPECRQHPRFPLPTGISKPLMPGSPLHETVN